MEQDRILKNKYSTAKIDESKNFKKGKSNSLSSAVEGILQLQSQIGNKALNRLLKNQFVSQTKLNIGEVGDQYEQEADQVANQIVSDISSSESKNNIPSITPLTQLKSSNICGEMKLQKNDAAHKTADIGLNTVENKINSTKGNGMPLSGSTQTFFEDKFRTDFSNVRIHTDNTSSSLNRSLGAHAFTTGNDIYMGAGKYSPDTKSGKNLLAHELTHVIQQRSLSDGNVAQGMWIQRKLSGTHAALNFIYQREGERHALLGTENWSNLLKLLAEYESQEQQAISSGTFNQKRMSAKLLDILDLLEAVQNSKEFKSEANEKVFLEIRQKLSVLNRQVLREYYDITQGKFDETVGFDLRNAREVTGRDAGGLNSVERRRYTDSYDHETESMFFKEGGYGAGVDRTPQEISSAIPEQDANYAGRAVALYRLDQILNSFLSGYEMDTAKKYKGFKPLTSTQIPLTEFAVGGNLEKKEFKIGTVMKGVGIDSANGAVNRGVFGVSPAQTGGVNLGKENSLITNPFLQRSLARLQLLDTIAAQMDRHSENIRIEVDQKGDFSSVQGIDNDLAFGRGKTDLKEKASFLGVGPIVDTNMMNALKKMNSNFKMVEEALWGLIDDLEIASIKTRLELVISELETRKKAGRIIKPENWSHDTAKEIVSSDKNSYYKKMAGNIEDNVLGRYSEPFYKAGVNKCLLKLAESEIELKRITEPDWISIPENILSTKKVWTTGIINEYCAEKIRVQIESGFASFEEIYEKVALPMARRMTFLKATSKEAVKHVFDECLNKYIRDKYTKDKNPWTKGMKKGNTGPQLIGSLRQAQNP